MKNLNPIYLMEMSLTQKEYMHIGKSLSAKARQSSLLRSKTVTPGTRKVAKKITDDMPIKKSRRSHRSSGNGIYITALGNTSRIG